MFRTLSNLALNGHFRMKSTASTRSQYLKQLALHSVGDGFQAIVRMELLVDVVQVVAQSLRGDSEVARNVSRVLAAREQSQDLSFML